MKKKIRPKNYIPQKKVICDWTNKNRYLVHCRMLKFFVGHGMVVDKFHEIMSFKQPKWVEKYIHFKTQKRNQANIDLDKDFYRKLNIAFL